ncbi:MAG TPA: hypothetical protein VIK91_14035 [Nannocystis sp.]|jgi:hypothetical protein
MMNRRHPARAADELRDRTRELIEEELDRLGEAGGGEPSVTEAVEMGLLKARELGLEAGLEPNLVDEVTRDTARRLVADAQHGRGRRAAKKSRHTTQILRESEGRGDWLGRPEPGPEDEQRGEAWRDQGSRP